MTGVYTGHFRRNQMAKFKRQPKAGELALRTSARFAEQPREIAAATPVYTRPDHGFGRDSVLNNPEYFVSHVRIKQCPAMPATGSNVWRNKGQMSGGISSRIPVARAYVGRHG
jgi:hypothetical protein